MGFSFNKLNRIALFTWLFIASLNYTVYANQQISVNPWFSDDSIPSNLDLVGQFNDDYLGNIAYRGARWQINHTKLNEIFSAKVNKDTEVIKIFIPTPDGTLQLFNLTSITVMAPKLALKYPQLRSFHGMQADKKSNSGRFDYSPDGFSGMFQYNGEWVLLTTNKKSDQSEYISYYAKDESRDKTAGISGNDLLISVADYTQTLSTKSDNAVAQRAVGEQIRTFRLAVSASAEYTNANGGEASAMAEIVRLVNRVNQVFLVDLAIQFELVDDNDRLIFSNSSTDPFTNSNAIEDIEANQDIIDNLIGPSNYDLGHLLNTSPGGVATLNSVCDGSVKAKAKSGSNQPTGESFHIQLVIHEFAHQLGATHTFNALDQNICNDSERWNGSSVEPGSGSTIMSYAGLCGEQNLQQDNDGYFHAFSINQIQSYLASRSCGSSQLSGNTIPLISDSAIQHTIPASTPFLLSAEVSDNDQDPLTYAWDQINPGRISGATATRQARETDNGANPLFRSFRPISTPVRYFPSLTDVINGVDSNGEVLPTEARQLNFELVVRDGRGGVNTIQAKVNIEPTGEAFSVSQPQASTNNSPVRWTEGQLQEVQWTTADSELSPISCANVDILLDADGNNTFETILESTTPNDGTHQVLSPNTTSTSARVMVKCSDNIFYAVNPGQFELLQGSAPVAPLIIGQLSKNSPEDSSFTISFSDISVDDPDTNYPDGFSLRLEQGSNYSFTDNLVTPETNFNGDLSINVSVNDGISDSNIFAFIARITPVNDAPVATADSITVEQDSSATSIDVLSNDLDPDHDILTITKTSYSGTGQVAIANNKVTYLPAIGFFGTESITYTIEDPSFATSTATLTITVTASPITPNPVAPLIYWPNE